MTDTSPKFEALYRRLLLALSPGRRVELACGMFDAARSLAEAGIRSQAGRRGDSIDIERELFLRFYARELGDKRAKKIWRAMRHGRESC